MTERPIGLLFVVSGLAALSLAGLYVSGGQPQLEGALLAVSLGGMGAGIILWAKDLFPEGDEVDERPTLTSTPEERRRFLQTLESGREEIGRRRVLLRLLVFAAGSFGIAALFPIRSLGPSTHKELQRTGWRKGKRLVADGRPVRLGDLSLGGVATVFPEGEEAREDSAAVLIHTDPRSIVPRPGRESWSPDGYIVYSKICTHVGCPVGLYRESVHELLCPCHQSRFDVLHGARPVGGPATRSLPQLPIRVDGAGFLVADGDFPEPVGPGFWNRDR